MDFLLWVLKCQHYTLYLDGVPRFGVTPTSDAGSCALRKSAGSLGPNPPEVLAILPMDDVTRRLFDAMAADRDRMSIGKLDGCELIRLPMLLRAAA